MYPWALVQREAARAQLEQAARSKPAEETKPWEMPSTTESLLQQVGVGVWGLVALYAASRYAKLRKNRFGIDR